MADTETRELLKRAIEDLQRAEKQYNDIKSDPLYQETEYQDLDKIITTNYENTINNFKIVSSLAGVSINDGLALELSQETRRRLLEGAGRPVVAAENKEQAIRELPQSRTGVTTGDESGEVTMTRAQYRESQRRKSKV